ncbi:hypothetical protein Zm00014a_013700 [Zea mays]|uniref:Uncharacterized protein n=2 Tax=Zea mays TaxID=4577 RepID=A0A3L6E9H9_MAIZE|nr:hypothetical protein ZEAMMB73_Zm00001d038614 [Zea mays]PWZ17460.1 hypothetical protein Zm00014a_013700 [Zea mays]
MTTHGVVSCPPPWLLVLKKRPAGLPARLCSRHSPPVASKKAFICAAIMPNRVGKPKRMPSAGLGELLRRDDRRVRLGWCAHLAEHLLG